MHIAGFGLNTSGNLKSKKWIINSRPLVSYRHHKAQIMSTIFLPYSNSTVLCTYSVADVLVLLVARKTTVELNAEPKMVEPLRRMSIHGFG